MDFATVPIENLVSRDKQVRQDFNEEFLEELTESIKKEGILVPIIVRKIKGKYEIVAGEQRWRAAKKAGLKSVPISLIDADEKKVTELALLENVKRKDLAAWEREDAINAMWESGFYETVEDLGRVIDVKPDQVKRILSARKMRRSEDLPQGASTEMIVTLHSLDSPTRKEILVAQERGDLARDVHGTRDLISNIKKAPEEARPRLVRAYSQDELPLSEISAVAEVAENEVEVEQLLEAKKKLPESDFKSIVSYIKKEKAKGEKPIINRVTEGEVHIWNSYLETVESIRTELNLLKTSKCKGWPVEERKRLVTALEDIEVQVQKMLNIIGEV